MRAVLIALGVVLGIGLLLILPLIASYNSLVRKDQAVDGQWAQVQASYQRRYDLIPNLVESTRAFFEQEQQIFEMITNARTQYAGAQSVDEQAEAANQLETALGRLLVIVEDNPEVRSQETVAQLMDQLEGTENRINVERGRYNDAVREYNTSVMTFPGNITAGFFGFDERTYFEAAPGAEEAPRVQF
jgi:LemA protein